MKIFENYRLKNLNLKNRIVMAPMCVDFSDETGSANEMHYVHYVTRAIGGVGLIIVEATAVTPNGRTSSMDLGIWQDSQVEGLKKVVDGCHNCGARIAVQLSHSGRKCELPGETPVAPSPLKFHESFRTPKELTRNEIEDIIRAFREAAVRCHTAGFDAIEIHAAHGYLIHEFLSPLSNKREDEYGGSLENRVRFLKEILLSIREVWPEPLWVRISASDYSKEGIDVKEMIHIVNSIKEYVDTVHVSSGGLTIVPITVYPGYQVEFSEIIKQSCNIPTIAVGLITLPQQAEEILMNERADLVSLGRELLRNPYWLLQAAYDSGIEPEIPTQYKRAYKLKNNQS